MTITVTADANPTLVLRDFKRALDGAIDSATVGADGYKEDLTPEEAARVAQIRIIQEKQAEEQYQAKQEHTSPPCPHDPQ